MQRRYAALNLFRPPLAPPLATIMICAKCAIELSGDRDRAAILETLDKPLREAGTHAARNEGAAHEA